MTPLDAALLGVVEGFTEFLPVSSTGHLILASTLLQLQNSAFLATFEIVIQLGAILAVIVFYFRSFFDIEILKRLIVAFIPTGIIGLALYKVVKTYLLGNDILVLCMLALGGIALILFELWHQEHPEATAEVKDITYKQAAYVGLFQALAIVPGVSRSAASIVGGLTLGIKRSTIVEFSFLLAVPTMVAASGLDLVKNASSFSSSDILTLGIGFVTAFVIALGSIRWLLSYVRKHSFIPFGVYRIIAAFAFFLLIVR
jgi:undecaprenyl-diphosphatase